RCRASPVAEEPARDQADEEEAELRVLVVELEHLVAVDDRESAVALADGGQCADPVGCEQADFAEYVSDAVVRIGLDEPDGPRLDEVEPVGLIPLPEQDRPLRVRLASHVGEERTENVLVRGALDAGDQSLDLGQPDDVQRKQTRMQNENRIKPAEDPVAKS